MRTLPQYPLERSPLYRLRNKSKLAQILSLSPQELSAISKNPTYYCFTKQTEGRKPRLIEQPIGQLDGIHKGLQIIFSRIESPSYLFSGKKKTTYVDNAVAHLRGNHFLSLDIAGFYPSSKIEYVFRFFRYKMLMSDDVAWLLSNIVTKEGHIPTGSYLSQSVAYWSYSSLFNNLFQLASSQSIHFSLYVDDITFSSDKPISKVFEKEVNQLIHSYQLTIKASKLKRGSTKHYKVVTGVAITPSKTITVPNKLRKKIHDTLDEYPDLTKIPLKALRKLIGRIDAARKLEPTYCEMLFHTLKKLSRSKSRTN